MIVTPSGRLWITNRYRLDISGEQSAQSDALIKNHQLDHIDEANVSAAKRGTRMASIYEIEKLLFMHEEQLKRICVMLGIDPTPMPENIDNIEELTDPDA